MSKLNEAGVQYVRFPETYTRRQLNALYREIPLSDTTSRLLRKYFNAAANLYGIILLKKLYRIILSQNQNPVSEEQFRAFAEIAKHECEDYYILGSEDLYTDGNKTDLMEYEVIDTTLLDEDLDAYLTLKQMQQDKPYYIPDKKTFLAYNDPFYMEPTEEAAALRDFLRSQTDLESGKVEAVFVEICYGTRCANAGISEVMHRLDDLGVRFKQKQTGRDFTEIYQDFHNQTRMQCNRGHSPNELRAMQPAESNIPQTVSLGPNIRSAIADGTIIVEELGKQILTMELPSDSLRFSLLKEISDAMPQASPPKKKVGRNDPCPCGSGKKYKKCCGR